jgi:hypothetical protein
MLKPPLVPGRLATTDDLIALRDELVQQMMAQFGLGFRVEAAGQGRQVGLDFAAIASFAGGFPAQITASDPTRAAGSASHKWSYTFQGYMPIGADPADWVASAVTGTAYNLLEISNDTTGIQGNGVDVANLPAGFVVEPVPVDTFVMMHAIGGAFWFSYENGIDGVCP